MVIMNDLEWSMLSYYVIYLNISEKIMQQTEKGALTSYAHKTNWHRLDRRIYDKQVLMLDIAGHHSVSQGFLHLAWCGTKELYKIYLLLIHKTKCRKPCALYSVFVLWKMAN